MGHGDTRPHSAFPDFYTRRSPTRKAATGGKGARVRGQTTLWKSLRESLFRKTLPKTYREQETRWAGGRFDTRDPPERLSCVPRCGRGVSS